MHMISMLGWLGTLLLVFSAVPQVIKVFQDGHADGISWGFLLLCLVGFIMMFLYVALSNGSTSLLVSYGVQLIVYSFIAFRKAFPSA